MSEERFIAIETKLDSLAADQVAMGERLSGQIGALDERLSGQLGALDERLGGQLGELDKRLTGQIASLDHQMRVLHEDTIANIKALAPDFAPMERKFQAADAKLKEEIDQRLVPLEAFARERRPE